MPDKSIIYGDIINTQGRHKLRDAHVDSFNCLQWTDAAVLPREAYDSSLVFVDLDKPEFSSPDFLLSLATGSKEVKIVGKSENQSTEQAIRVSKLGVSEILSSNQCLEKLHTFLKSLQEDSAKQTSEKSEFCIDALVGQSKHINEIRKMINLLSDVDFPSALILGETGTGKSFVAKILHNTGSRASSNMVEVNCSAIPDELFESELFGHSKGAFTDAKSEKMGLFEFAQNGTLFLDEVGNLSATAQAKLLKILEDKKLRRVGDVTEKDINVRVVAATNIDLREAIEAGSFREDLFFRLNLLTIDIPPLRERPEDIPGMVGHFLSFYSSIYGKSNFKISSEAVTAMQHYRWPGNVRELSNVIEKSVLLSKSKSIKLADIKSALKHSRVSAADRRKIAIDLPPQGKSLEEIEAGIILEVLNMCKWNKSQTAKYLKISRPRLRRIIDNHKLEQNRQEAG
ncbi:MAG: sigma-54-dependent Fis family transcriptional regulator [candidate division Zixibacteria bacterium]|nr:sigma-54-dependent Fis family transcriptional regulator [candidate division Zixibacteria bacterium]